LGFLGHFRQIPKYYLEFDVNRFLSHDYLFIYRPTIPGYTASSKLLIVSLNISYINMKTYAEVWLISKLPFSSRAILHLASDQTIETRQEK
jgi:hypothetical protein